MYYKVVTSDLKSSVVWSYNFGVQYIEGEWVSPKDDVSRLMVFDSLENAFAFRWSNGGRVYSCEVEDPTPLERVSASFITRYIKNFWYSQVSDTLTRDAPKGTIGVKRVKLLERIPDRVL